MTGTDIEYFRLCCERGFVKSPFLEIGSAKVQGEIPNLCDLAREFKVDPVRGVDLSSGTGVDFTFDFSLAPDAFKAKWEHGRFETVAVFNVLEHTYDPLTVLQNALCCTANGGSLVVVTPTIWPLHDFPGDYLRLLPHWYEVFASRSGVQLHRETFCWLSQFGITRIDDLLEDGRYQLPSYLNSGRSHFPVRYWISRFIHRIFNTFGRSHTFTHSAIGAVFSKPLQQ